MCVCGFSSLMLGSIALAWNTFHIEKSNTCDIYILYHIDFAQLYSLLFAIAALFSMYVQQYLQYIDCMRPDIRIRNDWYANMFLFVFAISGGRAVHTCSFSLSSSLARLINAYTQVLSRTLKAISFKDSALRQNHNRPLPSIYIFGVRRTLQIFVVCN